jgi:hypothetical protein
MPELPKPEIPAESAKATTRASNMLYLPSGNGGVFNKLRSLRLISNTFFLVRGLRWFYSTVAVIQMRKDPIWRVPWSIQREEGKKMVDEIEPGPNNPLGKYWIGLTGC